MAQIIGAGEWEAGKCPVPLPSAPWHFFPNTESVTRFFLVFLSVQAVLFGVEMLAPVQAAVVQPWTGLVASARDSVAFHRLVTRPAGRKVRARASAVTPAACSRL